MPYRDEETSVFWIESNQELADAVSTWEECVGLDTEFIRTDTFYPIPGLYQVASGPEIFLLDPLSINNWQPFADFLENPDTVKVMYACQEDLELINHHLGIKPARIFDTQFAHAFVGTDFSLSYANLARQLLKVDVEKQETRSNWLQRPLTDEQIIYAAKDVLHLVPMYEALCQALNESGRMAWFEQDMAVRGKYLEPDPSAYYVQVKKAWQLSQRELARLQALCRWRENSARHHDLPRNRIVWDNHLMSLALEAQAGKETLQRLLPRNVEKRYGQALLDAHAKGNQAPLPDLLAKPLTPGQTARVKALRAVAAEHASRLGFATELLARRKDVEQCLRSYQARAELSEHFQGWRDGILGDQFRQILAS